MNPRSKLRGRLHEVTSDAILDAAEEIFASRGIHQAKVEEIALRAGVSVGTVYNYFPDRDGVLGALIDARRSDAIERMDELLDEVAGRPFREQLEAVLRQKFAYLDEHREFFSILFQAEVACGPIQAKPNPKDTLTAIHKRSKTLVQRGIESGELKPELADLLPSILLSLWRAAVIGREYGDIKTPMAERASQIARMFLEGAGVEHV
jgi:AcrR family transcriptional regulator